MFTPGSPSRRESRDAAGATIPERLPKLDDFLQDLSRCFGLVIKAPRDGESPNKRQEKLAVASKTVVYNDECYFMINFLILKETKAIKIVYDEFQRLQSGWVYKPNADQDALPRSVGIAHPNSLAQLEQKFECFLHCIRPVFKEVKQRLKETPTPTLKEKSSFNDVASPVVTPQSRSLVQDLDDTPIPFSLDPKGKGKRRSDVNIEFNDHYKRTRIPQGDSNSKMIIDAIDGVPVMNRQPEIDRSPWITEQAPVGITRQSRTIAAFQAFALENVTPENGHNVRERQIAPSANTSFMSCAPVVFDYDSDASDATFYSTQESAPELEFDRRGAPEPARTLIDIEQSVCGSSFNEDDIKHEIRIPTEILLRQRLQNVFPDLQPSLENAPLAVRYEIYRICTFAKVNIMDLQFPNIDFSKFSNYDKFWAWLKNFGALKGKDFPGKSDNKAWKASFGTFIEGTRGVVLSAKLEFNDSSEGPFFKLQLQPLKLDYSQRLGRRFGPDRFFELFLPSLTGRKLPKLLKDAEQAGCGYACFKVIVEWLISGKHNFLGITWGYFFVKDSASDKKKPKFQMEAEDNTVEFCAYLFATEGIGFERGRVIPQKGEPAHMHTEMSVTAMLNWLIPMDQNKEQKVMKLFSRIALGLSRTRKTVEVQPEEFRYLPDIMSADNQEVMNDGCGRLSLKMAKEIAGCLDLMPVPSAFQARIGGAKGLWVVDFDDCSDERWIEIYPSQTKWSRDWGAEYPGNDDPDHRIFEVVDWAQSLRQAKLTLQFLQILEDRAKNKKAFRQAISNLLKTGLTREMESQKAAMDSPEGFRLWVRGNTKLGIRDRVKNSEVQFLGGLPNAPEEQINFLIDAGFNPLKQKFLADRAWKVYSDTCDLLKQKLKVTVGRSTYAFMAVDFTGTLEPDEVHLGFSDAFTDEASGFSECLLDGMEILVARSPAHYISDIQKVKAVWKRELKSSKNIIVFSSRGNYPLAKKLSGGDYDGDEAWICWEPSIVDEFINAEPPECPNLIELGHIRQAKTTYADLVSEYTDPIPAFLKLASDFNLQANMLGICTSYKESLCYSMKSVDNKESVFLSTLLSDLVDQHKQGYIFTSASLEKVKFTVIKKKIQKPAYKQSIPPAFAEGFNPHIIDYLKFVVAEQIIESTKEKFYKSLQESAPGDTDVFKMAKWARNLARSSPDWADVVRHAENEIKDIYIQWTHSFNRENPETLVGFPARITKFHEQWVAIAPPKSNLLQDALSPSCLPSHGAEYSTFALLKASLGFAMYYQSSFIWWMAGRQLFCLKAIYLSAEESKPGCTLAPMVVVVPRIHSLLTPDTRLINLRQKQKVDSTWLEEWMRELDEEEGDDDWEEFEF